MRKLATLFIILAFVLALGCSKEAPAPMDIPDETAPAPKMTQVEPEKPATPPPPPPAPEEKEEEEEETPETIGSRVTGTEQEPEEQELPAEVEEIKLIADKIMTLNDKPLTEKTVSVGTTLYWKNHEKDPHMLAVESGKGFDTIRHKLSPRILQGETFEYTFNEKGTFLVRDIWSGKMRVTVTVE